MTEAEFENMSWDERLAALPTKRTCGECNLCCTAMEVEEMGKPVDVPCSFLDQCGGCKIYSQHPESCKSFVCLWRAFDVLPEHWRPDKKGFLFNPGSNDIGTACGVQVDPKRPNIWREGKNPTNLSLIAVQLGMDLAIMNGDRAVAGVTRHGHFFDRASEPWRFDTNVPNMVGFDA